MSTKKIFLFLPFNPQKWESGHLRKLKERILTEQKIRRLIENAETPLRQIILAALNTGMRKAEILNLEWNQVNLEEGFITLIAQKTKSRKTRRIPLNKSLRELFYKLHYKRNSNQYVFENPKTGKAFVCINRGWRSHLKDLGIKGFRFHDLQHITLNSKIQ